MILKKSFIYPKLMLDIYPIHTHSSCLFTFILMTFFVFWRCTWGTLNEGDEIVSISSKLVRRMTRVDCVKALKGKTKCHLPCSSHLFCRVYFSFSLSDIHKTVHISFLDRHIYKFGGKKHPIIIFGTGLFLIHIYIGQNSMWFSTLPSKLFTPH